MLKQNPSQSAIPNGKLPLNLSSILLVEIDRKLRDSRRLLLGTLEYPVLAIGGYTDLCRLSAESNCCLVAIDISHSEQEAVRIAAHARRTWPNAKILLLGRPSEEFDDPLYDDAVDAHYNPSGLVDAAYRLLEKGSAGNSSD